MELITNSSTYQETYLSIHSRLGKTKKRKKNLTCHMAFYSENLLNYLMLSVPLLLK